MGSVRKKRSYILFKIYMKNMMMKMKSLIRRLTLEAVAAYSQWGEGGANCPLDKSSTGNATGKSRKERKGEEKRGQGNEKRGTGKLVDEEKETKGEIVRGNALRRPTTK